MASQGWAPLQSKLIFSSPHWDHLVDSYRLRAGSVKEYHYVRTSDSVMVVPHLGDDHLIMIRQLRVPSKRITLEFPGGGLRPGELPIEAARRELREETGYDTEALQQIGVLQPCNGLSTEVCTIFVADRLVAGFAQPDDTEELEVVKLSQSETASALLSSEPQDSLTVAAWFLFKERSQ